MTKQKIKTEKINKTRAAMENCHICQKELSKYTCPSCSMKTCSIPCLKEHKLRDGKIVCTGKRLRDSAIFTPFSRLEEEAIKDDFFLLEETEQIISTASTTAAAVASATKHIPQRKRRLAKFCKSLGVELVFLPSFMTRSKNNRSSLSNEKKNAVGSVGANVESATGTTISTTSSTTNTDKSNRAISWTVDFCYKGKTVTTHNNSSSTTLSDLIPEELSTSSKDKFLIYSHQPNKEIEIENIYKSTLEQIFKAAKPRILEYPQIIIK